MNRSAADALPLLRRIVLKLEPAARRRGIRNTAELRNYWADNSLKGLTRGAAQPTVEMVRQRTWENLYNSVLKIHQLMRVVDTAGIAFKNQVSRDYPELARSLVLFLAGSVARFEAEADSDLDLHYVYHGGSFHKRTIQTYILGRITRELTALGRPFGTTYEDIRQEIADARTDPHKQGLYEHIQTLLLNNFCVLNSHACARLLRQTEQEVDLSTLIKARAKLAERDHRTIIGKARGDPLPADLYHTTTYVLQILVLCVIRRIETARLPYWKAAEKLKPHVNTAMWQAIQRAIIDTLSIRIQAPGAGDLSVAQQSVDIAFQLAFTKCRLR